MKPDPYIGRPGDSEEAAVGRPPAYLRLQTTRKMATTWQA